MRHSKRGVFSKVKKVFIVPRTKAHKKRLRQEYYMALVVTFLAVWFTSDWLDPVKDWLSVFWSIFSDEFSRGFRKWVWL